MSRSFRLHPASNNSHYKDAAQKRRADGRHSFAHQRPAENIAQSKEKQNVSSRMQYPKAAPGAYRAMLGLETYIHNCGLEASLLQLIKMRASQINGCAFCLDMHSKDARAAGESEQRLYLLDAWREAPFYSERERAALLWTEALTLVADNHIPDDVYNEVRQHFTERELVDLSLAVVTINGWNRLAIAFRSEVGAYQAGMVAAMDK